MITTTQVALAFAGILAGLLGGPLLTLIGWVRGDLAEVKKTLADVKTNTDRIPDLAGRIARLEAHSH